MNDMTTEAEPREDVERAEPRSSAYYLRELSAYRKRFKSWVETSGEICQRYEGKRGENENSRYNILWSNTETLKSALYGRTAKPDVRRRFMDKHSRNAVNRTVAEALERGLDYCIDVYEVDDPIEAALQDHLLTARGQVWVSYDPEVEGDMIVEQPMRFEYVHWRDFAHGFGRRWDAVPWVGRKRHGSKKEIEDLIGGPLPRDVQPEQVTDGGEKTGEEQDTGLERYAVWEIWDRTKRVRVYVVQGIETVLREDPDPYGLKGFFPCPRPLFGPMGTNDLVPTPEFTLYEDQADEVDAMTARIDSLTREVKWRGFAKTAGEDGASLPNIADAADGEFQPVTTFPGETARALWDQLIAEQPIDRLVGVIESLRRHRAEAIQAIYEITGISDLIRGASDPNETATAQRIKGQYGSMRMKKRQGEVQRFIRDLYRIKAELIAEHWTAETFAAVTGLSLMSGQQKALAQMMGQQVPDGPTWDDVLRVLRSDELRAYAVDIETDSTVFEDAQEEKQARVEFTQAITAMLEKGGAMVAAQPKAAALLKEITLFGVRGFKVSRTMEESLEEAFDQLAQVAQQPKQPDAQTLEVQRKAKKDAQDAALEAEKVGIEKARLQHETGRDTAELTLETVKTIDQVENKPEAMPNDVPAL